MTVDPNRRGFAEQTSSGMHEEESLPSTDVQGRTSKDPDATVMERHPPKLYEPPKLERLGAYRIVRELGSGGMGTVYEAQDQILGRRVALKVLKSGMPDEADAKKRFLREAQSAAAVTHDHIVTIYQVGEDHGTPFLAMQLLDGESLEERLERPERFRVEEIIRIGHQIAEGLAAANQRGLIHRDIKPANIWLEAPKGRVKILDFGLARGNDTATQLTQSGVVMGTPAYMSPEQANGDPLDGRTDLFSLGCILYELATGTRPFDGPTFMAIIAKLATFVPPPAKELNPAIPVSLSNLISELLAKSREERPASAAEVANRLESLDLTDAAPTFFQTPSLPRTPATPFPPSPFPTLGPRPAGPALPSLPAFTSFNVPPVVQDPPSPPRMPTIGPPPASNDYPLVNHSQTTAAPPSSGGGGFFKFFLILLVLGGGGYLGWTQFLDRGTLIVESEDPLAEIDISQHGVTRHMSITTRRFELRPGTYDLNILRASPGFRLDRNTVTIERGKTEVVHVSQNPHSRTP